VDLVPGVSYLFGGARPVKKAKSGRAEHRRQVIARCLGVQRRVSLPMLSHHIPMTTSASWAWCCETVLAAAWISSVVAARGAGTNPPQPSAPGRPHLPRQCGDGAAVGDGCAVRAPLTLVEAIPARDDPLSVVRSCQVIRKLPPQPKMASVRTKRSKRKEREPIILRLAKVVEFGDEPFRASGDEVGETNGDSSENADDCNTMSEDDNRKKMTSSSAPRLAHE
jgi:hypothetical protein